MSLPPSRTSRSSRSLVGRHTPYVYLRHHVGAGAANLCRSQSDENRGFQQWNDNSYSSSHNSLPRTPSVSYSLQRELYGPLQDYDLNGTGEATRMVLDAIDKLVNETQLRSQRAAVRNFNEVSKQARPTDHATYGVRTSTASAAVTGQELSQLLGSSTAAGPSGMGSNAADYDLDINSMGDLASTT